jgi:hypothetical protein
MIESKWMNKAILLLILVICSIISVQAQPPKRTFKAEKSFPVISLKNINKIELMNVESRMGNIEKVDETKIIEGKETQQILNVWREQKYGGGSAAACHQPPYAIKFYSKNKIVLFVTVCWSCHNLTFIVPEVKHWVDFESDTQAAKKLKATFEKAFPSKKKFG